MDFLSLCTDTVSVFKSNGEKFDNIPANVRGSDSIFIPGTKPFIESGDLINRKMSNGGEETYEVIDPGFREKFRSISESYHVQVKKLGIPEAQKAIQNITYHINGNNARINQNSTDSSTNIVNANPNALELLAALRSELANLNISEKEKQSAVELLDVVDTQIQSGKPSKTVISAMFDALPQVVKLAGNVSEIIDKFPQ